MGTTQVLQLGDYLGDVVRNSLNPKPYLRVEKLAFFAIF